MTKTALFINFTNEEFKGYWDGKGKTFKPGQSLYMPDYLAKHFAKHLVNKELVRIDKTGKSVYKKGETFTSPKKPEDVPIFMELFNKAYKLEKSNSDDLKEETNIDTLINVTNKNREKIGKSINKETNSTKPQVILPPDFDESEDDSEASFKGQPVEIKIEKQVNNNQ